ncbi:hypothetical protein [Pseudonocardia spinosispora]|uniref:hypothetical protein n=1 Tax=Pseudonocardia spinosispora TaxID=103441 RepID=UPI000418F0F2|nr:hypothetical protein [Pseudonocardia spinosispora]
MTLADLGHDLATNWLTYISMPILASAIGYFTKLVAIEMMFKPIEFAGKPPLLGWQGIIPRNAGRMATIAMDLLLGRLIDPKEILGRMDSDRLVRELREPLNVAINRIGSDLMTEYYPDIWEMLPNPVQRVVLAQIRAQTPKVVSEIMEDFRRDMDSYLDVRDMAITNLTTDKAVLNRLVREVSRPEMRFIARSGLYFGLGIGVLQAITWALTHQPLIMPIFGALVGLSTDWIALKMIFYPREPRSFCGVRWQGMFQKRRKEVAADYGKLIAEDVLTVSKIMEALLTGPKSDRLLTMVQRNVGDVLDRQVGLAKPWVVLTVGSDRFRKLKRDVAARAVEAAAETMKPAMDYATDALAVERTIVDAMLELTPLEFEKVLRPAFQQDEWKLILVGGILGGIVGELQVHLVLALTS